MRVLEDYVRPILEQLNRYGCQLELDRLVELGADKNELLRRLLSLTHPSIHSWPPKLKKHVVEADARRIWATAKLVESYDRHPYGSLLHGANWRETRELHMRLSEFADRLDQLPRMIEPRWEPIKVAAICQFVWLVKRSTNSYHDALVAPIIGALLFGGRWDADALKQWRKRHALDIEVLGPLGPVLPIVPGPARKFR